VNRKLVITRYGQTSCILGVICTSGQYDVYPVHDFEVKKIIKWLDKGYYGKVWGILTSEGKQMINVSKERVIR